jgi:hypothetical protein
MTICWLAEPVASHELPVANCKKLDADCCKADDQKSTIPPCNPAGHSSKLLDWALP